MKWVLCIWMKCLSSPNWKKKKITRIKIEFKMWNQWMCIAISPFFLYARINLLFFAAAAQFKKKKKKNRLHCVCFAAERICFFVVAVWSQYVCIHCANRQKRKQATESDSCCDEWNRWKITQKRQHLLHSFSWKDYKWVAHIQTYTRWKHSQPFSQYTKIESIQ